MVIAMGSVESKMVNFSQIVYNQAAEESRAIMEELKKAREKELEQAKVKAEQMAAEEIAEKKQRIEREINEVISKTQLQIKNQLIRHREEIESKVFDKAKAFILEFAKSERYYPWLVSAAKHAIEELGGGEVIVYINASDEAYRAQLAADCGAQVELLDKNVDILGGVRVRSVKARKVCNDTLAARLESMHSEFLNISGLKTQ